MADTIREKIMQDIKTSLEKISVVNGYVNDVENVQRWEQAGNSTREVPCIIISADPETKENRPSIITRCLFSVNIDVWARHDKTAFTGSTDAFLNTLLGDVEKALLADYQRSGLAEKTTVLKIDPFTTAEGQPYVGLIIEVEIQYVHTTGDPTAQ